MWSDVFDSNQFLLFIVDFETEFAIPIRDFQFDSVRIQFSVLPIIVFVAIYKRGVVFAKDIFSHEFFGFFEPIHAVLVGSLQHKVIPFKHLLVKQLEGSFHIFTLSKRKCDIIFFPSRCVICEFAHAKWCMHARQLKTEFRHSSVVDVSSLSLASFVGLNG